MRHVTDYKIAGYNIVKSNKQDDYQKRNQITNEQFPYSQLIGLELGDRKQNLLLRFN